MEEFDGKDWVSTIKSETDWERDEWNMKESPGIRSSPSFPISRREIWTKACYELRWKFQATDSAIYLRTVANNYPVFFREKFVWTINWKLNCATKVQYDNKLPDFEAWLGKEYPDIVFEGLYKLRNRRWQGWSPLISSFIYQVLVTAMLAGLTWGFNCPSDKTSRAAWLLVFLFGGSIARSVWCINDWLDDSPDVSFGKWFLFGTSRLLAALLLIGIFGGISVVLVGLVEDICSAPDTSVGPGVWTLVSVCTCLFFSLLSLIVIKGPDMICMAPTPTRH
jgi:hypothetical protein